MDITDVYCSARKAYDKQPDQEQLRSWNEVLAAHFTPAEVQRAVREWQGDTSIDDFTQKPRGNRFPPASEIKLICERNQRASKEPNRSGSHCGRRDCHSGFTVEHDGRYPGKDVMVASVCPECRVMRSMNKQEGGK